MEEKEWFEAWFDQPIYHLLYQDRNDVEAHAFIDKLLSIIQLPTNSFVLDLACGKGRHAAYLATMGFDVTGIDLSAQSIQVARGMEKEGLAFYQADMRHIFRVNYFDAVFNFFTSFGYFNTDREHARVIRNAAINLKPNGYFVLDYLNTDYVLEHLVKTESKVMEGIVFDINRSFEDGYFFKAITVKEKGVHRHFVERVRGFHLVDFQQLFGAAGLTLISIFGDYQLNPFDALQSERLILLAQKTVVT